MRLSMKTSAQLLTKLSVLEVEEEVIVGEEEVEEEEVEEEVTVGEVGVVEEEVMEEVVEGVLEV